MNTIVNNKKIILTAQAYLDNWAASEAVYVCPGHFEGEDTKLGDTLLVAFEIINTETDDAADACDWEKAYDIKHNAIEYIDTDGVELVHAY